MPNGHNTVLVRLRAVAMERDDNSDGWVPMGTGGLSCVSIVKRSLVSVATPAVDGPPQATASSSLPGATAVANDAHAPPKHYEYLIYGHRLIDQSLVFRCLICKDFEYNKVMPTFHNWKSGGKRVGLIFQTAADGRVFDRGIMQALVELSALNVDGVPSSYSHSVEDNEVFMTVELPYKLDKRNVSDASRHVSPQSTDSSKGTTPSLSDTELKTYRFKPSSLASWPSDQSSCYPSCNKLADAGKSKSAIVTTMGTLSGSSSTDSLKKPAPLICRHCRAEYTEQDNPRGSCPHADDCVKTTIDTVTCIPCVRTMFYHCMSDSEGNFAQPCDCNTEDSGCVKRWTGLGLLSLLLPCLWCYPPLKLCHLGCVSCGVCGGKHQPVNNTGRI